MLVSKTDIVENVEYRKKYIVYFLFGKPQTSHVNTSFSIITIQLKDNLTKRFWKLRSRNIFMWPRMEEYSIQGS